MSIPIQNIYYLLCYAWEKLPEAGEVPVGQEDKDDVLDLLARVLVRQVRQILKKGLDQHYVEREQLLAGVRGKIEWSASMRRNAFAQGQAICSYGEMGQDILPNQLLKATLHRLIRSPQLDPRLKSEALALYRRLGSITLLELHKSHFRKVVLHRNNLHYRFPIRLCELIVDCLLPDEEEGRFLFRDFQRDPQKMHQLFEEFVRSFYQTHLAEDYTYIGRETIHWQAEGEQQLLNRLPHMQTDVTLISPDRKIILDAKFYQQAVSRVRHHYLPDNLYQLYAYLQNQEDPRDARTLSCEGILLYPFNGKALEDEFYLGRHRIRVCTVNLSVPWREIHARLFQILKVSA